ncbi:MAG: ATP-binding protein [Acetobacter sp.]|nr:ATP-binding protein [Acetobacter sp.]
MNNKQEFSFKSSLIARIKNFSMTPNENNALMPLFEAVTNSLQAISERYKNDWIKNGNVEIFIYLNDTNEYPENIEIKDNGIGFNENNFESFLTFDSLYKQNIGGKGIGRFSWLKAFESAHVESFFIENGKKFKREFDFVLDDKPIKNHLVTEEKSNISEGTTILLKNMKSMYRSRFPSRMDTVLRKLLVHFLPVLVAGSPSINIISDKESSDIKTIFEENSYNVKEEDIDILENETMHLKNLFLDKKCLDGRQDGHAFFFSANNRIVDKHSLNNQLGMSKPCEYEDKEVYYIGILTGSILDKSVFGERNSFDLSEEVKTKILKAAISCIKEGYLKDCIDKVIDEKSKKLQSVLDKNPRYKYLVKDTTEYAKNKLSLSAQKEEDILKELAVYDHRENVSTDKQVRKILDNGYSEEEFDENFSKTISRINEQNKSNLHEYIAKRKVILDIISSRLKYENSENLKNFKEAAIHKIICPMNVSSNHIDVSSQNLWIINDKLSFYKFWASDKEIKKYIDGSDSKNRPDLALFNGCISFGKRNDPVVIVEFKRPGRDDYTNANNPIQQVYDYIDEFRGKNVTQENGEYINIADNAPFFCYVICDITNSLKAILKRQNMYTPLVGQGGYFGYNPEYRAFIEIIDFRSMIEDAKERNKFFFKELGIDDD